MSILIRKIGRHEYAYNVVWENGGARHRYIGRADDPSVDKKIRNLRATSVVPDHFRRVFWDTALDKIDLRRHKKYVIERILELGNFSAFQWLARVYPGHLICRVSEESRQVSAMSKNFWRLWFDG